MNLPLVALATLLASVVASGLLVGGVALLSRIRTLDARARHALWFGALVAIALLPIAGIATSVARAIKTSEPSTAAATWSSSASSGHTSAATPAHSAGSVTAAKPEPWTHVRNAAGSAVPNPPRWTFLNALSASVATTILLALALGAVTGIIGLIVGLARVASVKRRSSPLDETLSSDLPWLTASHSGRETYLRLSYEIETPVAIGFGRPVILIPTDLATHSGLQAIEDLVVHEYAHLTRFDDYTNLIQRLIERVFWFNPFVWIAGRHIALEREIAADDAVVARTSNSARYAEALWRLAREMRMPTHALVAPGALFTRKQISVRIEALLAPGRARLRGLGPASSGIAAAFALASFAIVALAAPPLQLPVLPQAAVQAQPAAPPHIAAQPSIPHSPANVALQVNGHPAHFVPAAQVASEQQRIARLQADANKLRSELEREHAAKTAAHSMTETVIATETKPSTAGSTQVVAVAPVHVAVPATHVKMPGMNVNVPGTSVTVPGVHVNVPSMTMSMPEMQYKYKMPGDQSDADAHAAVAPNAASQSHGTKKVAFGPSTQITRDLLARCTGCDLSGRDLRNLDLHGLTLTGIDLSNADLRGANLSGTNLTGADLRGANLSGADLTNAKITGADVAGTIFRGARMNGVEFTGISLRHANFDAPSIRALLVHGCTGCDLSHMDLHGIDFHGVTMTGSDFAHSDLTGANFSGAKLSGVSFDGAKLDRADLRNASLVGCSLNGASMNGAQLEGISLSGTSLGRDP